MARAVVLTFEDNQDADRFIEYHRTTLAHWSNVALVVALPTQFCEGGHKAGKFSMAFLRGMKFGWWVCRHCAKPANVGFMKTLRACLSQGVNLLEDDDDEVEDVFDRGWGALNRG